MGPEAPSEKGLAGAPGKCSRRGWGDRAACRWSRWAASCRHIFFFLPFPTVNDFSAFLPPALVSSLPSSLSPSHQAVSDHRRVKKAQTTQADLIGLALSCLPRPPARPAFFFPLFFFISSGPLSSPVPLLVVEPSFFPSPPSPHHPQPCPPELIIPANLSVLSQAVPPFSPSSFKPWPTTGWTTSRMATILKVRCPPPP